MARPAAESPFPDNVGNLLKWEELDSWRTPSENFFFVNHYGQPDGLNEATWRVGIAGLVARPQSLTLADLKARPRREVDFTLGVLGQHRDRTGLLHRRHRQCPLGGHATGPAIGGSGCPGAGHRSGLLGGRSRHGDNPRQLGDRQWWPDGSSRARCRRRTRSDDH